MEYPLTTATRLTLPNGLTLILDPDLTGPDGDSAREAMAIAVQIAEARAVNVFPPETLQVYHAGKQARFEVLHLPGHSPGSIGLWEARTGTLFSGDAIYDGPLLDAIPGADEDAYRITMERLRSLPVTVVHGGHVVPLAVAQVRGADDLAEVGAGTETSQGAILGIGIDGKLPGVTGLLMGSPTDQGIAVIRLGIRRAGRSVGRWRQGCPCRGHAHGWRQSNRHRRQSDPWTMSYIVPERSAQHREIRAMDRRQGQLRGQTLQSGDHFRLGLPGEPA